MGSGNANAKILADNIVKLADFTAKPISLKATGGDEVQVDQTTIAESLNSQVVPSINRVGAVELKDDNSREYFEVLKNWFIFNSTDRVASFNVLQRWEGYVRSVGTEFITAEVINLDSEDKSPEEIEVDWTDIDEGDRSLVEPGAVFYWHVGYSKTAGGQDIKGSVFRFRRLPAWTRAEIKAAKSFAEKILGIFARD